MPAKSKAQQKYMGLAYALKKGDVKPSDVSKDIRDTAKGMTKSDLKKYASTKHKGLPNKVEMELEALIKKIDEEWSDKYKRSIDCNNPKGFSQKAHCQGRKKNESLNEDITKRELNQIEVYVDKLYSAIGVDVEFTRHFLERLNDPRNVRDITPAEVIRLFREAYKKHGKKIARLGANAEAVIKDMTTDINMPFVIKYDRRNGELDLIAKTVMRKKSFRTPDQVFVHDDYNAE